MEAAVRDRFCVPLVRYTQELYATLDEPAALRFDALLVSRLQRLRVRRRQLRARPFGER